MKPKSTETAGSSTFDGVSQGTNVFSKENDMRHDSAVVANSGEAPTPETHEATARGVELKPCPFERYHLFQDKPYERDVRWDYRGFRVHCSRCGTTTPAFADKETAVKCWNTRADSDREWQPAETCKWSADFEGVWWTDCDEAHVLTNDGPTENNMKFCCYCGKPLEAAPYKEPEDEV